MWARRKQRRVSTRLGADAERRPAAASRIRREREGTVEGVVHSQRDEPLSGLSVMWELLSDDNVLIPEYAALTSANGAYKLVLPPATYRIHARGTDTSGTPVAGSTAEVTVKRGKVTTANIVAVAPPE